MSKAVKIPLVNPITIGKTLTTEITIRPLKGKYLRRLKTPSENAMPMIMELIGLLSGETDQVIDELEGEDLHQAMEVASNFLEGSQKTGKK